MTLDGVESRNDGSTVQSSMEDDGSVQHRNDIALTDVVVQTPVKLQGSGTYLKELRNGEPKICMECGNSYRYERWFEAHVEKRTREGMNGRSLDVTLRLDSDMVYKDKTVETYKQHERNPLTTDITIITDEDYRVVRRGWVKDP